MARPVAATTAAALPENHEDLRQRVPAPRARLFLKVMITSLAVCLFKYVRHIGIKLQQHFLGAGRHERKQRRGDRRLACR